MTGRRGRVAFVERRRLSFVAAVVAAFALAGAASVLIHPAATPPASGSVAAAVRGEPGATSTAWFCAGPLPVGTPHEASSIAIVNRDPSPVTATVTIVLVSGATTTETFAVAGASESVVGLSHIRASSFAAARVIVDGSGVEVVELVHGAAGPDASPCTEQATGTQYLLAGNTEAKDNLAIALFDPGATPAVANVTFATPIGPQAPPAFQGVQVAAGHVVVLYVAHSLPFRRFVSATVRSSGGAIVAGALDIVTNQATTLEALEGPIAGPATRWFFAAAPAGASAQQTFDILNPGKRTASVEIHLGGPTGVGEISLSLGPGATTRYAPAPDESAAALRWASVTSRNDEPVVAARELAVASPIHVAARRARSAAARRRVALFRLPSLPVGFTVTTGVPGAARQWILAGGQSDAHISEFVTVTNTGAAPATVEITPIAGSFAGLGPLTVAADGSVVVDLADLASAAGRLSLRVTSDVPVVAADELYVRAPGGSPGLAAPAALPVG